MKTNKVYKILMIFCLTLITSLSTATFSTISAEQAHASCETEHVNEYSFNSYNGIDLDQLNLATEKEGIPLPNFHMTSQMNSAIDVSSNCTGNGSFCPGTCNAYQYVGYHYGATTIPYRIEQSAIDV